MAQKGYYNAQGHESTENEKAIADFSKEAAKCGMTYGQFQAKQSAMQIKIVRKWHNPEKRVQEGQ